jgi:hypothetical protein
MPCRRRTRHRGSSSPARRGRCARLAGRIGDGWTAFESEYEQNLPTYLEALETSGRRREDQLVLLGVGEDGIRDDTSLAGSPWVRDPQATWERWHEAGVDGAAILARSVADVDALVAATERW